MPAPTESIFDTIDTNHNGVITREEFMNNFAKIQAAMQQQRIFDALDTNHNGVLTREEFMNNYALIQAAMQQRDTGTGVRWAVPVSPAGASYTGSSIAPIQGAAAPSTPLPSNMPSAQGCAGASYTGDSILPIPGASLPRVPLPSNISAAQGGAYFANNAVFAGGAASPPITSGSAICTGGVVSPPDPGNYQFTTNTTYGAPPQMIATSCPHAPASFGTSLQIVPPTGLPPTGSPPTGSVSPTNPPPRLPPTSGQPTVVPTTVASTDSSIPDDAPEPSDPQADLEALNAGFQILGGAVNTATTTLKGHGKLFLDDKKNWQAITDIMKAFLIVESDEQFLLEEIRKLPGGEDALKWLTGGTWEKTVDPKTGKTVYVNPQTGETWEEQVDPKTGKTYYVNPQTGETSENKPNGGIVDLPPGWESRVDPVTGKTYYINPKTGERSELVPGWEKRIDPKTGKPYYVNTTTGETSSTPPVGGIDAALNKVNNSIHEAKEEAHKEATQARQEAATAKAEAAQIEDAADAAMDVAQQDEAEHEALVKSKERAHADEKKAEDEAKRLAELLAQAQAAAEEAKRKAELAKAAAAEHHAHASHMQSKVQESGSRLKADPQPAAGAVDKMQIDAAMKHQQAQKAQNAAQRAQKKADDALARVQQLEAAGTTHVAERQEAKTKIEEATRQQEIMTQAKKKVEGLKQLSMVINIELGRAETAYQQAHKCYVQKQHAAAVAKQAAQVEVEPEIVTPEDMAQAILEAKAQAAKAQAEVQKQTAISIEMTQHAQAAEAARDQVEEKVKASTAVYDEHDELEKEAERAAMAAEQAKADAEAMAAAAAAALRQLEMSHSRAQKADEKLDQQVKHSKDIAQKEHKAFAKRFGEGKLPDGWKVERDPETGKAYYVGPNGEVKWEKPGGSGSLPLGWQVQRDPKTGKSYYVGPNGEVTWEKPGGSGNLPPGWKVERDPKTGKSYYIGPNGEATWEKPAGAGSNLPPGWEVYNDPATGKPYYVGPDGQVSWDNPSDGVDPDGDFNLMDEAKQEKGKAGRLVNKANKKMEEAEKAESQAKRMEWLIKAFEHACKERKKLEQLLKEARRTSRIIEKDVEGLMGKLSDVPVVHDTEDKDGQMHGNADGRTAYGYDGGTLPGNADGHSTYGYDGGTVLGKAGGRAACGYDGGTVTLDMFERMDFNKNGVISKDEFMKFFGYGDEASAQLGSSTNLCASLCPY